MSEVVVIGAGLAGLSAACHLTGRGHHVTVLEREPLPGGRSGQLVTEGFTFDTGPSVLTMPDLIADALSAVGTRIEDVLPLRRLDPAYRASYADGSTIRVRHGRDAMREEIRQTCGSLDAAAFDDFVEWLRRLYRLEMPNFIDRNFDSPLGLLSTPIAAAQLIRLGGFGKLGPAIRRRFRDPRLHRLFSFQALYAGLSPESALALYAVITYMDSIEGVWFPEHGGMHAVPTALATAAEKAGAVFRYSETVTEVLRRSDSAGVAGVRLAGGEQLRADAVVCTLDLPVAYRKLLPDLTPPRKALRGQYSPSAVVWHVGVRGIPDPSVAHHNIHFGQEWGAAFDALLEQGRLMPDPSRLVTIPSIDDPSVAPPGCSTLFVLEPVPNLSADIDWTTERGPMRERLHSFLQAQGYPSDIVTEQLVTPLEWEQMGMHAGTPFSLAHTFGQTGPFRPANTEKQLPGMVFAGSGTVPGVGVPMVLISGSLAAERVDAYVSGSNMTSRPVADPVLAEGYRKCAELTRRYGTTYFWGAAILARSRRRHVHAVYALCRLADDIVDDQEANEGRSSAEITARLEDFAKNFRNSLEAGGSADPLLAAVIDTVLTTDIDPACFDRFFGAMAMDLTITRYETWDDLCGYMEGSAAVIGEMMLPVLQPLTPAAREPARALGLAFQLTNFLRDVNEDLDLGRVYLPQADLRRFGVDLTLRRSTPEWRAFMAFQIERNRALYRLADAGIPMLPPRSARCVAAARDLYSQILDRVEQADYDVFSHRVRVPTIRKALTAGHIMVSGPPRGRNPRQATIDVT